MELGTIKIILIIIVGMLYFFLISTLNSKLKRGSRAAQFKVGGRGRHLELRKDESREDRRKRREVSLRGGRMWKRRF